MTAEPTGTIPPHHLIAGRLSGVSGIATFCACGHAYFARYGKPYADMTDQERDTVRDTADQRWEQHRKEAR